MNDIEYIFTKNMYQCFKDAGIQSVSGHGSNKNQTRTIIKEIPLLFQRYNIKTVLDAPCGDWNWMSDIDLSDIQYIGVDIVKELIDSNIRQYGTDKIQFRYLNIIEDRLPNADIMLCRDCLVHFSDEHIFSTLKNIYNSNIKYLLTTVFPLKTSNTNIKTGQWRPINFMIEPFLFPTPIEIINEDCTQGRGKHADKSLGLWKVRSLK